MMISLNNGAQILLKIGCQIGDRMGLKNKLSVWRGCLLIGIFFVWYGTCEAIVVKKWEIIERTVVNSQKYENPFSDEELNTVFWSPSGREIKFYGFFDGDGRGGNKGNIWKFRFMPDELGQWRYRAVFGDGRLAEEGHFEVKENDTCKGPIRPDANNPRWIRQADGPPFFLKCYLKLRNFQAEDDRWKDEDRELLLARGYNCLLANGLPVRKYNDNLARWPHTFVWQTEGDRVDYSRYDLKSWRRLEEEMAFLGDEGVVVFLFDGFFGGNNKPDIERIPNKKKYIKYVLARLAPFWNITWNLGFEWQEFMPVGQVVTYATSIKALDPWQHMLSVHGLSGDFPFCDAKWADYVNLQTKMVTKVTPQILEDLNRFIIENYCGKPIFASEVLWERNKYTPDLDGEGIRKAGWSILMAGGFFAYADHSHPKGQGHGDGQIYVQHMFKFMEETRFWKMSPQNELVSKGNFCLADPGGEYVIYASKGGEIVIDLRGSSKDFSCEFYNPRNGRYVKKESIRGGKKVRLETPDKMDWVIYLNAEKY